MSTAGPPQGARPLGGEAQRAYRGGRSCTAGPPQGARPLGGEAQRAYRGGHTSAVPGEHTAATLAYLGLGSNLADPRRQIAHAVRALSRVPGTRVVAVSPSYATAPVGAEAPQPDYVNAVVAVRTTLKPRALLAAMHAIERRQHRNRESESRRNAPRTLDLDLLLYGRRRLRLRGLDVPHPRMHERAFVLRPLVDVDAIATIPGRGLARRYLRSVAGQRIAPTRSHMLR